MLRLPHAALSAPLPLGRSITEGESVLAPHRLRMMTPCVWGPTSGAAVAEAPGSAAARLAASPAAPRQPR